MGIQPALNNPPPNFSGPARLAPHPGAAMWPLAAVIAFLTVALSGGKNARGWGRSGHRNNGRRGQARRRGRGSPELRPPPTRDRLPRGQP